MFQPPPGEDAGTRAVLQAAVRWAANGKAENEAAPSN